MLKPHDPDKPWPRENVVVQDSIARFVYEHLNGLYKVVVVMYENGGETKISGFDLKLGEHGHPEVDADAIIQEIFAYANRKSEEEMREISCRAKLYTKKRTTPFVKIFRVIAPEVREHREDAESASYDEVTDRAVSEGGAMAAMAAAVVRGNEWNIKHSQELHRMQEEMIREANQRASDAMNREHNTVVNMMSGERGLADRERLIQEQLTEVMRGTIHNTRVHSELERDKVRMEAQVDQQVQKKVGEVNFLKELTTKFSEAMPMMAMAAMAKFGVDPQQAMALMPMLGAAPPGAQGFAPAPPPGDVPPPPPGPTPGPAAPPPGPPPGPPPTPPRASPSQAPPYRPSAPAAPPRSNGQAAMPNLAGLAATCNELGETMEEHQWQHFKSNLQPSQILKIQSLCFTDSDTSALAALMQMQSDETAFSCLLSGITEEQGLILSRCLDIIYAANGQVRPSSTQVEVEVVERPPPQAAPPPPSPAPEPPPAQPAAAPAPPDESEDSEEQETAPQPSGKKRSKKKSKKKRGKKTKRSASTRS